MKSKRRGTGTARHVADLRQARTAGQHLATTLAAHSEHLKGSPLAEQ